MVIVAPVQCAIQLQSQLLLLLYSEGREWELEKLEQEIHWSRAGGQGCGAAHEPGFIEFMRREYPRALTLKYPKVGTILSPADYAEDPQPSDEAPLRDCDME